eukprot:5214924-Pyramimonas_sp.AAC.1
MHSRASPTPSLHLLHRDRSKATAATATAATAAAAAVGPSATATATAMAVGGLPCQPSKWQVCLRSLRGAACSMQHAHRSLCG